MNSNKMVVFIGMGFELVGIILACIYLGKVMDEKWGTRGMGLALVPMVGLVGWITQIVILTRRLDKSEPDSDQDSATK